MSVGVAGGLGATAGSWAALANFVPAPVAAGLGAGAGGLVMLADAWRQRRQGVAQADASWSRWVLAAPAVAVGSRPGDRSGGVLQALNPDERVVPFSPLRRTELLSLAEWCRGTRDGRVWLVTGDAGSGKTRLLVELVEHLEGGRVACGWVGHGHAVAAMETAAARRDRVLLIVDDVDASPRLQEDVAGMLRVLAEIPEGRVKVVLCGREFSSWWAGLRASMDPAEQAALVPAGRTTLSGLLAGPEDQAQQFQGAVRHFARHFGRPVPVVALDGADTSFSVAELHAAAAIAAYGGLAGSVDPATALRQLFTAEEAWWRVDAAAQHPAVPLPLTVLQRAMTAAALLGADSLEQAVRRLAHLPGLTGSSVEQRTELALWLRQLYKQRGGQWLDPHLPAHLVDRYAALRVAADPGLAAALAGAATTA
ncbi:hypothetical protein [Streptomyces sp. NPDC055632]